MTLTISTCASSTLACAKRVALLALATTFGATGSPLQAQLRPTTRALADARTPTVQFVVTSDVHYGIARKAFRGDSGVPSARVNTALLAQLNRLSTLRLPSDSGVRAGQRVGAVDFVAITGDIANRAEEGMATAAESWAQFRAAWLDSLTLRDARHHKTHLYIVPGNHDISNAIGYYRPLHPGTDATAAAGIFNLMMHPRVARTAESYNYATDRTHFGVTVNGVHLAFLNIWPDSAERAWLARDLAHVSVRAPVLLFAHDPPAGDAKHFINPQGTHDINATDRFENLLSQRYQDGTAIPAAATTAARVTKDSTTVKASTDVEQREFVAFLNTHANIAAYFHGHNNFSEFYDFRGPDSTISLPTVRVDSPMKGAVSANDETKLSFAVVTIDTKLGRMTVREVLWNSAPSDVTRPIVFCASRTVSIAPRLRE
jgi:hypothetical protein